MKKNKEYILFISLFTLIIIFLFNKFIFGQYIFVSADTLAPQAIKQSIKSSLDSFPLWFPYIFSGMPTIHSLLNINNYYLPHHFINFLHNLGMPWIWNFLFHYIFAAIGMYLLLRFLKQSKITSFLSSVLFSLSPYMIAYLVHGHGSQIMSAAYIPWIILFLFKIYNKNSIKNYCMLSILIGLQLQRAHIQIVYYTWMMIGLFIIIKIFLAFKTKNINFKKYFYNQLLIISSIIVGFLTSLSIYLPILNYSTISTRGSDLGGIGIEKATQWSLNFNEITTFILPHAYGFGGQTYWGYLPFTDFPNYIGIIVFFLAIVGFYKSDIKKEYKIFFILTMFFSFLISLGHNLISFYKIFYYYFPFFDKFRVPIFILILFQFSIYIYAAIGLSKLPDLLKNNFTRKIIFSTLFIVLGIYIFFSFQQPQLFRQQQYNINDSKVFDDIKKEYLIVFQNIDLDTNGVYNENDIKILNEWLNHDYKILNSYIKFSQYQNTSYYNPNTLIQVLKQTNDEVNSRIKNIKNDYIVIICSLSLLLIIIFVYYWYGISKKYFLFLVSLLIIFDYLRVDNEIINPKYHIPNKRVVHKKEYLNKYLSEDEVIKYLRSDNEKFRILDKSGSYNKNRWAAFNIENINGYHPAKINLYDKLLRKIQTQNNGVYHTGLLQLLNIKYIIHENKGILPDFNIIDNEFIPNKSTFSMSFFNNENIDKKDIYIYKNNNFLNRIFITRNYEFVTNNDIILDKIISKDFNPVNLSFINQKDLNLNQINQLSLVRYNHKTKIDLISWESDQIKFKVNAESPQLLILSEIFHPGWIINDNKIKIFRINGIFRGIIIPAGEKEIVMKYKPFDILIGRYVSLLSYLFLITIFLYNFIYRRKSV